MSQSSVFGSGSKRFSRVESWHRKRRLRAVARGVVLAAFCAFLVVIGGVFHAARDAGAADSKLIGPLGPEPPWICRPPAQPGAPRPWEAPIQVSTYSVANAVNRNLFTAIPIVSWQGVGPDVNITLYHNSANVGSGIDHGLGEGWSISYDASLKNLGGLPQQMLVRADDGTEDIHTYNAMAREWLPPAGVHDKLARRIAGGVRRLTHKDQSYHGFGWGNELVCVGDGLGNEITIDRDAVGRLETVTDASGRVVEFIYDESGLMTQIKAHEAGEGVRHIDQRVWTLTHTAEGFTKITDPAGFILEIGYDPPDPDRHNPDGRITSITDMRSPGDPPAVPADPPHTYQYRYVPSSPYFDYNELLEVTDPDPEGAVPPAALTQSFATSCPGYYLIDVEYTDRRGEVWTYEAARAWEPENGPLDWIENPLGQRDTFVFDADRHMTWYQDASSHEWDYTYDDKGNVLTVTNNAIAQTRTWTYDGLNNLTSYTNPECNTVEYDYDTGKDTPENPDDDYSTLLSTIVEPEDEPEHLQALTSLEYYIRDPIECALGACDHGQLKRVTDPNGRFASHGTLYTSNRKETLFKESVWKPLTRELY